MFYDYAELEDGTQIAYSGVLADNTVEVVAERPIEFGFDSARCVLPAYTWSKVEGFSDADIKRLDSFVGNNAPLILRFAHEVSKNYA